MSLPLIGHESTLRMLEKMISGERLPHALLFCGPKSVGKRTVAQWFAAKIFKHYGAPTNIETLMRGGTFPDLIVVHPEAGKKDISVDAVRALRNHVRLKPYYAGCKIGIIDDAERMSQAAYNSLLMTLEEPPEGTYLILVSSAPHRLPATILSRCTIINFGLLSSNETDSLCQALGERVETPTESLRSLKAMCDGSLAVADLDRFIDPITTTISNPSELGEHLMQLSREFTAIQEHLESLNVHDLRSTDAVTLASVLTEDTEQLPFVWLVLRRFLRTKVREGHDSERHHWAELLEQLIQSERWVKERNASAQLHINNLLLSFGS